MKKVSAAAAESTSGSASGLVLPLNVTPTQSGGTSVKPAVIIGLSQKIHEIKRQLGLLSPISSTRPPAETILFARRHPNGRLAIMHRQYSQPKPKLNREEQHAQAQLMVVKRIFGEDNTSVAGLSKEFDVSEATVQKRLTLARQTKIPDQVREYFIKEMLPASMAVVQEALAGDDLKLALQAAKMVIEGLEAMKAPQQQMEVTSDDSLEVWRERIKVTKSSTPTIEVQVIEENGKR